jgi:hypothetical protein
MRFQDLLTIIKKIGIGILLIVIPFLIYFIGLRIIQCIR